MKPLFFGSSESHLYGVYQPPVSAARKAAVLLLYPGFHEYNALHWDFRRLTGLLSQKGFAVLRFDYYGTGDSAGTTSEATFRRAIESTRVAADELLEQSGARQLIVVGCRLGAAVGYSAIAEGMRAAELVMWEPVLLGAEYLRQLQRWDDKRMSQLLHFSRQWTRRGDLLGYPLSEAVRAQLEALDITQVDAPSATRLTLVSASEGGAVAAFEKRANERGARLTKIKSPVAGPDDAVPPADDAQNAGPLLSLLVEHLSREKPL